MNRKTHEYTERNRLLYNHLYYVRLRSFCETTRTKEVETVEVLFVLVIHRVTRYRGLKSVDEIIHKDFV